MSAQFAPITHPSPLAHPAAACIPAPTPSIHDMHEAMDWTAEYSALAQVRIPKPLGSPQAMRMDVPDEPESSPHGIALKLGLATVDVEYEMVAGCVYVQGATVNDEWVDVDCFAPRVTAAWRREIERSLGVE